ncbi:hypothetical protein BGI41_04830 [Methanobrevibacter sp. 87.7]|uniref:DUF3194 domain-containing protein n=1 Tax=Methanobrevibacter sp. 87.7 TaxID=387957 RepID=UPI000B500BAA|nr:DUF3194 domain-containing protein [Methanobrevibacter sp. 87.7]OWT32961.1 hypothetical protein BGI41_04830 [Methanobrevibacter sp. 87.7]
MSKLKKLSQKDLEAITEYLSSTVENKLSKYVSSKEVIDQCVLTDISYENEELNVDLDIDVSVDALSNLSQEDVQEVLDDSYKVLDQYIDENFRE